MAPRKLFLALTILALTGADAHAQLLGGRGLGGGLGPGGIGGFPAGVPVRTAPIATPTLPPAPSVLSNPVSTATAPLSNVAPPATGSVTGAVTGTVNNVASGVTQDLSTVAAAAGRDLVGRPLGQTVLARDERGLPIVAGEVLAVSPSEESLAVARRLNFRVVRQDQLASLGLSSTVLAAPPGMDAVRALSALRQADPKGTYDYANIYNPTGQSGGGQSGSGQSGGGTASSNNADLLTPPAASGAIRIGMIDGGLDPHHSAFAATRIVSKNFAGSGNAPASLHGTAIASLLAGADKDFTGYLPGANLYAADVFGGEPTGGSAAEIALALNWLAQNNIAVANISLAGPPNALLGAAVKAFIGGGHVLVAATGNDGPAAPPNYPAAYDGVIGVTAADASHHLALDASRAGARFAALGVQVRAALSPAGYTAVSGTSYASPLVAARFALLVAAPSKENCQTALATLTHDAQPLPESGIAYLSAPSGKLAAR